MSYSGFGGFRFGKCFALNSACLCAYVFLFPSGCKPSVVWVPCALDSALGPDSLERMCPGCKGGVGCFCESQPVPNELLLGASMVKANGSGVWLKFQAGCWSFCCVAMLWLELCSSDED